MNCAANFNKLETALTHDITIDYPCFKAFATSNPLNSSLKLKPFFKQLSVWTCWDKGSMMRAEIDFEINAYLYF
jgi:hypothetical protein